MKDLITLKCIQGNRYMCMTNSQSVSFNDGQYDYYNYNINAKRCFSAIEDNKNVTLLLY